MDQKQATTILRQQIHKGMSVMTLTTKHGVNHRVRVFISYSEMEFYRSARIEEITCFVKSALQYNPELSYADFPYIELDGYGYNFGFDVVSSLSRHLFKDTYGLIHADF